MLNRYLLVFIISLNWANQGYAKALLLSNVQIVDPAAQEIRQGHLLIVDNLVRGTLDQVPADFEGEILDLKGKWVMPGLNELHTHSGGNRGLNGASESIGTPAIAERLLSVGVTSLLDLFSDEKTIFNHRQDQRDGKTSGADIFASLSCLTAPKGHCTEYGILTRTMSSPEEATAVVKDLALSKPDVIKINYNQFGRLPNIDKATLSAAISEATKSGIKTVVHINSLEDIRDAIEAGANAVTHLPRKKLITAGLARLMAKQHVAAIPTLATRTDWIDFIVEPDILSTPMAQRLTTTEILNSYAERRKTISEDLKQSMLHKNEMYYRSTKILADAGVMMLTGSDGGNSGTIQGYSVHRELVKMVRSGLSTWQALSASTTNAGIFLNRQYGVNAGDEANLVILSASPIEDISNTQRIEYVIHHGKVVVAPSVLETKALTH
ncbi:MAG: imidazolonepropionase-like amidohydrolase [Candidatus Azotimanducaceae bacterium]|jgi:imidazolonepropionase-like amidohydrolase